MKAGHINKGRVHHLIGQFGDDYWLSCRSDYNKWYSSSEVDFKLTFLPSCKKCVALERADISRAIRNLAKLGVTP